MIKYKYHATMNQNSKYIFGVLLMVSLLTAGAYYLGKCSKPTNIALLPPFPTFKNDSLGVYRVVGTEHYISADKQIEISISYIQLGNDDSFYQLKLSTEDEAYYGSIFYDEEGIQICNFASSEKAEPIKFYNGCPFGETYIIIDKKKMPITPLYLTK